MTGKLKNTFTTKQIALAWSLPSIMGLALLVLASPVAMAQKASSTTGESRYATLDGARIHYKNYGKGREALVFIHGWTCNLDNWRDQVPDFAKRNRVIALDLPGHGQSDKPEIAYSMDLFAQAIDAVMRDAKVKRGVLVGHSMGDADSETILSEVSAEDSGNRHSRRRAAPVWRQEDEGRLRRGFSGAKLPRGGHTDVRRHGWPATTS